ncbi:hypothetical protein BVH03_17550 [Pseudomonas sp. PA15(2017)]|uniref:hypothetical protein n=1 Tax=Pseudomonas sp. PA15(2017) TaxID=1932111 RepID=UPI0009619355|nr:hypothetical protein [Pseudomonas sp. PA15(2017)]OLU25461.1 hypothetical protein BVH03_17550 [Pseudomonas sp. PA15(2017)]
MKRKPLNMLTVVIGLLALLAMAGSHYATWLMGGWAKAAVFSQIQPDDLFFQTLPNLPIFFLVGVLTGVLGTLISLEGSGEKSEAALLSTGKGGHD